MLSRGWSYRCKKHLWLKLAMVIFLIFIGQWTWFTQPKIEPTSNPNLHSFFLSPNEIPWYYHGGKKRPEPAEIDPKTGRRKSGLWPNEAPNEDRVENQLMFVPPTPPKNIKKILLYNGFPNWVKNNGNEVFKTDKCPVDLCTITTNTSEASSADAIMFRMNFVHPGQIRHPRQVWIWSSAESPYHTDPLKYKDVINWTMTYRSDSDLMIPYNGLWKYYDPKVKQKNFEDQNYASNKTKNVVWVVSNCQAQNNRLKYAKELKKYIDVDIYGRCGDKKCKRSSGDKCIEMLGKTYRFYLAFENSNCREYITEKIFKNAFGGNMIPIVMGAHPDDYARRVPENSYIHVDDFKSPKELADYLYKIIQDENLYNSFFRWKGTGEFIKTSISCRLCAMLHDDYPEKFYHDIDEWWRGNGVCRRGSWRDL